MNDAPSAQMEALDRVRAVLFDLDGTLIAVDRRAPEQLAGLLIPFKGLIAPATLHRLLHKLVTLIEAPSNFALAMGERMGLDTDSVFGADSFRRLRGLGTSTRSSLVPGALGALHSLKPHFQLAVVTSRSRRSAVGFLEKHGIQPFFDVVTSRHDTWLQKPSGQPIRRTAALLGVRPADCLMVGDTFMDIRSARRAGARAVGVLSGLGERPELVRAGAQVVVQDVGQLAQMLLSPSS